MFNCFIFCSLLFSAAKFLKLEQVDHEPSFANDTAGVSLDGTGKVGTYFYTAPEIEQAWPHINEKVKVLDDQRGLFVLFYTCDFTGRNISNIHSVEN